MITKPTLSRRKLLVVGAAIPTLGALPLGFLGEARANDQPVAGDDPFVAGSYRFNIGDFKATVVSDGYGSVPFWPVFAANQTEEAVQPFLKQNRLGATVQGTNNLLVVDTGTDRVMVDTGFGDVLGPEVGHFPWLVANLKRAGITFESITMIIISHIHFDHVAGILSKAGDHVFPNAKYVVVDDEWAYWTGNRWEADVNASKLPDPLKKSVLYATKTYMPAIKGRMQLVRAGEDVAPGITLLPAPGHSPAMTAIRFSSGNDELIHMADTVHKSDSGLQHPEWSIIFDSYPEQGIATRKRILGQVAADRTLVMGYHFPFPGLGYVEAAGPAYRWNSLPWSWG
jgi:glyoxylase-like metal-dependent hydrolase (beta-lactamase superfamily II)